MKPGSFLKESCGSFFYSSPEIVKGIEYNGTEVDAWSCGVVLYAMLFGRFPFNSNANKRIAQKIIDCEYKLPWAVSEDAQNLLKDLLCVNPLKRLTVKEALNSRWFQNSSIEYPIGLAMTGKSENGVYDDIFLSVLEIPEFRVQVGTAIDTQFAMNIIQSEPKQLDELWYY